MFLLSEDGFEILSEDELYSVLAYQTLPDMVFEAVKAALEAEFTDLTVERTRRAPVDAEEEFPRIVILPTTAVPDDTQSPGETFWRFNFVVQGYAAGADDPEAEYAQMEMHGRVIAALNSAELGAPTVMATAGTGEYGLYSALESALPAGQFSVNYEVLVMVPSDFPFVA